MNNAVASKIVVMAGLIIIAVLALWQTNQIAKNQAVDNCFQNSLVHWQANEGGKGTNFVPEWFKQCLDKKGYKN